MKHQDIHVRPVREEDIEPIATYYCFPWTTLEASRELWQKYYEEQKAGIRTVAVLETGNKIVGYGSLPRHSEYPYFYHFPEINNVWIDDEYRRSGLGKKLIAYLEDLARNEGYTRIGIGVGLYKDYGPAQKLYYQLGYAPDGHGITYKCQPVTAGQSYPVDDDLILWLVKTL